VTKRQIAMILVLLLAWGLRLCCLEAVPPGWRDDELINIHALSGELLGGRFPLYFTGASGHEPLYHWLHAGVHAVLGSNVLSAHLLSAAFGLLSIALTYALARRLFGHAAAVVASLALTTSFWSLMYSRTAIRHISLPPFALAVFCLLPIGRLAGAKLRKWVPVGLLVGVGLYTYPAARLLLVLVILFAGYLALFHRDRFRRCWRGVLLALVIAALVSTPLWVAIARGRSEAAAQGIGADARLDELAVPLRELRAGNLHPLLENVWGTLGMFHATGDPEWLYNISGRPVFNLLGGLLLWMGVVLCLYRWRQPRCFFLLLWLGLGLLPTFVSIPPASLSHSILVQPAAYVLPALPLLEAHRWLKSQIPDLGSRTSSVLFAIYSLLIASFLTTNIFRDLSDYFVVWPEQEMVRVLYRADYRDAARYLDAHPEIADVAISSTLLGPWDRLALRVDVRRDDVAVRLFDPERALVWATGDGPSTVLLTSWPPPARSTAGFLEAGDDSPEAVLPHLTLYTVPHPAFIDRDLLARFANGLELVEARWEEEPPVPGQEAILLTTWRVVEPLDLPPIPIVANPPPPGVYSGRRLAVFTHLLAADGALVTGDDGLWVDPLTLQPGDRFIQVHRFELPPDGSYTVELGLYDPKTGERWEVLGPGGEAIEDRVLLPTTENE
jgi:4-amino-4-deoxy-L-arabinose transferase-like glycosyltransferase